MTKFLKKYWFLLFVGYAGVVIIGTMGVQGHSLFEWIHILVPPGRIRDMLIYPLQHHDPVLFAKLLELADTGINMLLFFPLGIAIFLALRTIFLDSIRTILIIALALGLILSIGIETFQYLVPNRIPSVSDVIANSGGAVFGCYMLYFRKICRELKKKEESHRKHESISEVMPWR